MFSGLLLNIRSWYVRHFVKLDKAYKFKFDEANPESISVEYLSKFKGIIISFSDIQMEDNSDRINCETTIITNPLNHDTSSKKFNKFTSDVFYSIILNAFDNEMMKNENRTNNSTKSDQE